MELEAAIIHSYNETENTVSLSQKVLNLSSMPEFEEAMVRVFQSFLRSSQIKKYHLEDSDSFAFIQENDFVKQSQKDAKKLFEYRKETAKNRNILFLACKFYYDDKEFYVFHEFHLRTAFVSQDDQIEKEFILPDRFASSKFSVFLDLFDYEGAMKISEKDFSWAQEAFTLDLIPNAKEAYKMIDRWTQEIAMERGMDPLHQSLENKKTLNHLSDSFDVIASDDFSEEVLGGLNEEEEKILSERFQIEKIDEDLDLSALRKARVSNNLLLTTEKGIEIKIPLKDVVLEEVLEIDEANPQGRIVLNNLGKISSQ